MFDSVKFVENTRSFLAIASVSAKKVIIRGVFDEFIVHFHLKLTL